MADKKIKNEEYEKELIDLGDEIIQNLKK